MKRVFYRVLTIAWMAAMILLSIQPVVKGSGIDIPRQIFNNILHIPAYGLLTFLLIKSAPKFKYVILAIVKKGSKNVQFVRV